MRKRRPPFRGKFFIVFLIMSHLLGFSILYLVKNANVDSPVFGNEDPAYEATLKRDTLSLMMAYPNHIKGLERDEEGKVYIILHSGKKLLYDDKKIKNSWQKSGNPDLQDMLEQRYPLEDIRDLLPEHYNPGVIRVYPLFREVYGSNKEKVLSNLVKVSIGYKFVEFNQNNGADEALKSVMKELLPLARKSHKIYSVSFPSSGTFNYRIIGGTNRLSSHAFGISIDLNNHKFDYWRYATREEGQKRLSGYPAEVPRIFERYGFIWGGKWGNFDIMHYEYRPEVIFKARYFANDPIPGLPWYDGLQNNAEAMKRVWLIEETLG